MCGLEWSGTRPSECPKFPQTQWPKSSLQVPTSGNSLGHLLGSKKESYTDTSIQEAMIIPIECVYTVYKTHV